LIWISSVRKGKHARNLIISTLILLDTLISNNGSPRDRPESGHGNCSVFPAGWLGGECVHRACVTGALEEEEEETVFLCKQRRLQASWHTLCLTFFTSAPPPPVQVSLGGTAHATNECREDTSEWNAGGGISEAGHLQPFPSSGEGDSRAYDCGRASWVCGCLWNSFAGLVSCMHWFDPLFAVCKRSLLPSRTVYAWLAKLMVSIAPPARRNPLLPRLVDYRVPGTGGWRSRTQ